MVTITIDVSENFFKACPREREEPIKYSFSQNVKSFRRNGFCVL